jgi:hypothetical protein
LTGPFSLIRELSTHTESVISICHVEGILEITLYGFAIVTSKFLEGMKKSGFVLVNIRNSIDPEFLSKDLEGPLKMECLHDVPIFVWTIIRFKDKELPPLEDDDVKCDTEIIAIDERAGHNEEKEDMDLQIQDGVNN